MSKKSAKKKVVKIEYLYIGAPKDEQLNDALDLLFPVLYTAGYKIKLAQESVSGKKRAAKLQMSAAHVLRVNGVDIIDLEIDDVTKRVLEIVFGHEKPKKTKGYKLPKGVKRALKTEAACTEEAFISDIEPEAPETAEGGVTEADLMDAWEKRCEALSAAL